MPDNGLYIYKKSSNVAVSDSGQAISAQLIRRTQGVEKDINYIISENISARDYAKKVSSEVNSDIATHFSKTAVVYNETTTLMLKVNHGFRQVSPIFIEKAIDQSKSMINAAKAVDPFNFAETKADFKDKVAEIKSSDSNILEKGAKITGAGLGFVAVGIGTALGKTVAVIGAVAASAVLTGVTFAVDIPLRAINTSLNLAAMITVGVVGLAIGVVTAAYEIGIPKIASIGGGGLGPEVFDKFAAAKRIIWRKSDADIQKMVIEAKINKINDKLTPEKQINGDEKKPEEKVLDKVKNLTAFYGTNEAIKLGTMLGNKLANRNNLVIKTDLDENKNTARVTGIASGLKLTKSGAEVYIHKPHEELIEKISEELSEDIEKMSENLGEKIAAKISESIGEELSEKLGKEIVAKISEKIGEGIEETVKEVSERIGNSKIAQEVSEGFGAIDYAGSVVSVASGAMTMSRAMDNIDDKTQMLDKINKFRENNFNYDILKKQAVDPKGKETLDKVDDALEHFESKQSRKFNAYQMVAGGLCVASGVLTGLAIAVTAGVAIAGVAIALATPVGWIAMAVGESVIGIKIAINLYEKKEIKNIKGQIVGVERNISELKNSKTILNDSQKQLLSELESVKKDLTLFRLRKDPDFVKEFISGQNTPVINEIWRDLGIKVEKK